MKRVWLMFGMVAAGCLLKAGGLGLGADTLHTTQGSSVGMPIYARYGFQDIVSIQGTIEYDTSIVRLDSVRQFNLPGMGSPNIGLLNDRITFSWDDPTLQGVTRSNNTVLFMMYFSMVGNPGDLSPVLFSGTPTQLEYSDTSLSALVPSCENGWIMIDDTGTTHLASPVQEGPKAMIAPHPADFSSRLIFPEATTPVLNLTLLSMDGRMSMQTASMERLQGGSPRLGDCFPEIARAPEGIYLLQVRSTNHTSIQRFYWSNHP